MKGTSNTANTVHSCEMKRRATVRAFPLSGGSVMRVLPAKVCIHMNMVDHEARLGRQSSTSAESFCNMKREICSGNWSSDVHTKHINGRQHCPFLNI